MIEEISKEIAKRILKKSILDKRDIEKIVRNTLKEYEYKYSSGL